MDKSAENKKRLVMSKYGKDLTRLMDMNLVAHAKDYIDDLARGIDPLSKEPVSDHDIINNVRISRCLYYVSDILREVIANGGVNTKKPPKPAQEDFDLEKIDLSGYVYSTQPVTVTVIAGKINELKPETMKKLKVTAITNWLVDVKLLSNVQINGKNYKRPTAGAESLGITMEQRSGQYGTYYAVLYNEAAQRFIIDNLSAILDGGYNAGSKKSGDGLRQEEEQSENENPATL